MNTELLIQLATLISVIIGFVSLIATIKGYRREMNAQVIMKYSERFEHIMDLFPDEFFTTGYSQTPLPPQSTKLTLSVLKYLHLTVEEFNMQKKGYMLKDVWKRWEPDIRRTLRNPLLRREWPTLRHQFEQDPDFLKFVEDSLSCLNDSYCVPQQDVSAENGASESASAG